MRSFSQKKGRGRRYDFQPAPGYANRQVALAVSVLDELLERVCDQIVDLPAEALNFVPHEINISIARLVLHMSWAEAGWIRRLTGKEIPAELEKVIQQGALTGFSSPPPPIERADELIALCQRVRDQYTKPTCKTITDLEAPLKEKHAIKTAQQVFLHLLWHWTYHSGQIGIIRFEWGSDYQWAFHEDE